MTKSVRPEDVVRGILDPKQACEALTSAGFFPAGFFETGKRFFCDRRTWGARQDSTIPRRVSHLIEIAHDPALFLTVEALATQAVRILIDIQEWCRGFILYRDSDIDILALPETFLWMDPGPDSDQSSDISRWNGWRTAARLLDVSGYKGIISPQNLADTCKAWESDVAILRGDAFLSTQRWFIANFLAKYPGDYLLRNLENPFRPLLEITNICRHSEICLRQWSEDEFAISLEFNAL